MTRWIVAVSIGLLMLGEMLLNVPDLFAGAFDQLSPGNQKAVRALFEAQRSDLPPGTTPLTLDQIAARKQSGQGWGRIFDGMKSQGLVDAKNFGETVSSFNHRHHPSSPGPVTTAANRVVGARGGAGVGTGHGDAHASARVARSAGPARDSFAASDGGAHGRSPAASTMSVQTHGRAAGSNGGGHR